MPGASVCEQVKGSESSSHTLWSRSNRPGSAWTLRSHPSSSDGASNYWLSWKSCLCGVDAMSRCSLKVRQELARTYWLKRFMPIACGEGVHLWPSIVFRVTDFPENNRGNSHVMPPHPGGGSLRVFPCQGMREQPRFRETPPTDSESHGWNEIWQRSFHGSLRVG